VAGRLFLVCGAALAWFALCVEIAHADGKYQSTKEGKTLVWNSDPKTGDVVTWSGDRDSSDYARGFGRLIWYTKEKGSEAPQLYARYWGRMAAGKFDGPVNVHVKRTTRHAIFVDGTRVTGWAAGTAPTTATARWRKLAATRSRSQAQPAPAAARASDKIPFRLGPSDLRNQPSEPEAPAAGPVEDQVAGRPMKHDLERMESIQDLYSERWPRIDVDDSLRLLAFPPKTLRSR